MKNSPKDGEVPFLPATAAGLDLGSLPLGSTVSRAAARKLLEQRETEENDGLRFQGFDIVTGQPIDLEAMAREGVKKPTWRAGTPSAGATRGPARKS